MKSEFASLTNIFTAENLRYFRLPIPPIAERLLSGTKQIPAGVNEMVRRRVG